LPPREAEGKPTGEHVEEVDLHDYDPRTDRTRGANGGEAYDEDSDDEGGAGPRVQCAHQ